MHLISTENTVKTVYFVYFMVVLHYLASVKKKKHISAIEANDSPLPIAK